MAPKRRLFQPKDVSGSIAWEPERPAPGPIGSTQMSLGFEPPPPKPKSVALEDEIRLVTDEPDDDLATAKMVRLLRDRGEELRGKWGDDAFTQVADTFRKRVSKAPVYAGQPAPDAKNMFSGMDQPGAAERDFEGMLGQVAEIPTMAAQAWGEWGVQPIPAEQLGYHNRDEAMARTFASGLGQAVTALPDVGVGIGTMVGTGIAEMTGGAPTGPSLGDQGEAAVQPFAAAGEYLTSSPALATDMLGGDPEKLPGVLARSEAYIRSLYARAAENPAEPAFGALMAGGAGRAAIAGKRRLFNRPQPAPVETAAQPLPMEQVVNPAPYSAQPAPAIADQTQVMPSQPIAERIPQRPAPQPAAPRPRTMRDVVSSRNDPNVISAADLDGPAAPARAPAPPPAAAAPVRPPSQSSSGVPDIGADIEYTITGFDGSKRWTKGRVGSHRTDPTTGDRVAMVEGKTGGDWPLSHDETWRPAARQPEPPAPQSAPAPAARQQTFADVDPALSFKDVDAMIARASASEPTITERQVAPGKKRISMSGAGPGRVRLSGGSGGGRGRGRGGRVAVPSIDQIRNNVREIGRDIVGAVRERLARNDPRPAPPPGSAGGPGAGVPFVVEKLRPVLRPAASPRTLFGAGFEMVAHPSAWGSFFERTGINAMATQAERIGNTIAESTTKFLFGDDRGKAWLRDEFQKAGRDLWSAVVTFREGGELSALEQAAIAKHRGIFDQFVGPAFKFLDHVRGQNVYRDLGETYWPYDWGTLADVNSLLGEDRPGWTPGKGTGPDKVRTTSEAPLRNPVDVIDGYAAALRDKLTRRQMLQQLEELAPKLDERGKMLLSEYVNGVVFKQPHILDRLARDYLIGDALKNHPKPGETFPLDGGFELEGELRVVDEGYESPTRGQTYNVEIDGRAWPVALSGPELAALQLGKRFPSPKPVSAVTNMVNKGASYSAIASNLRSLWRQLMGGQARFLAEAEVGDYSYGNQRAAEYFRGTMPEADLQMLRQAGVLDGETSVQGIDLARSALDKGLFWNVYLPDTQTKTAAWFAEWNRTGRESPSMPREARMDASTAFALRVSDLNLSMVQAPWGNTPGVALVGLFAKSRLRELRHVANMSPKQAGKYAGVTAAALGGLAALGNLNSDEMKSVLWSTLPFGEMAGELLQKAGLPGGAKSRHDSMLGAAGVDIVTGYPLEVVGQAVQLLSDLATGRVKKLDADETDSRMRKAFPLKAAYRAASDFTRATLGDRKVREAARASFVTAPQPPYKTEYQKESGSNSSGGRRGKKRRLFSR